MYSCQSFLSSLLMLGPYCLSFIMPILAWNVPLISPILRKKCLVFPILLFCSTSLHCALKCDLSRLAILWNSTFSWVYLSIFPCSLLLFFPLLCQASSGNQFLSFLFLCDGFGHCRLYNIWTSVCNSSGTLSTRSHPLNLFITSIHHLCNHKGFDLGHTWLV